MFKSMTVFKIAEQKQLSAARMQAAIPEPTAADPGKTEWMRVGFSKPDCFGETTVFVGANNTRVLNVQVRERMLPGKVIKKHVADKVDELEARQGHKVNRKDRAQITDEVVMALLPTAFIRQTDVLCMVRGDYFIIGTSNQKLVELCIVAVGSKLSGLTMHALGHDRDPRTWMYDLLIDGSTASGEYECGMSAVLKDEGKRAVRFKDIEGLSGTKSLQDALKEGFKPVELSVQYGDKMRFVLTDKMLIKGIKFNDLMVIQAKGESDDAVSYFDATLAIVSGEIKQMLDRLTSEINEEEEL